MNEDSAVGTDFVGQRGVIAERGRTLEKRSTPENHETNLILFTAGS
jgi:hypothetical protein